MAAVTLPAIPKEADVNPRLIRAGGDVGGQQGGSILRLLRLGSRYALDVVLPKMAEVDGRAWLAAILESDTLGSTLVAVFPQPALAVALGAPLVDGAGQSGATLALKGLTAGVTVPMGRFFSFTAGGRQYLHMTRQAVVANGLGKATVPIGPKIRKPPADGAAVDFVAAKIEGFMDGQETSWTVERLSWFGAAFTLKENR